MKYYKLIFFCIVLLSCSQKVINSNIESNIYAFVKSNSQSNYYEVSFFYGGDSIVGLTIQNSRLNSLPADIGNIKTLITLNLTSNNLSKEDIDDLKINSDLKRLTICNNKLDSIPNLSQTKIEELDLSNNNIKVLDFKRLPLSLKSINMSFNKIDTILQDSNIRTIQELNLTGNKIHSIDKSILINNKLSILKLKQNDIRYIELVDSLYNLEIDSKNYTFIINPNLIQNIDTVHFEE